MSVTDLKRIQGYMGGIYIMSTQGLTSKHSMRNVCSISSMGDAWTYGQSVREEWTSRTIALCQRASFPIQRSPSPQRLIVPPRTTLSVFPATKDVTTAFPREWLPQTMPFWSSSQIHAFITRITLLPLTTGSLHGFWDILRRRDKATHEHNTTMESSIRRCPIMSPCCSLKSGTSSSSLSFSRWQSSRMLQPKIGTSSIVCTRWSRLVPLHLHHITKGTLVKAPNTRYFTGCEGSTPLCTRRQ